MQLISWEVSVLQTLLISTLRTLFTSPRMPWNKVKVPIVSRLREEIQLRLRRSSLLREVVAKLAVVFVFTVCWLLIVLVHIHVANDPVATAGSSLPGLAAALQQGAISGRAFQS